MPAILRFLCVLTLLGCINLSIGLNKTQAQIKATITGKVVDSLSNPISLVNIACLETNTGTTTSENGTFSLNLPAQKKLTVVIQHVGFTTDTLQIQLSPDEVKNLSVYLRHQLKPLDEVIIQQPQDSLNTNLSTFIIDPLAIQRMTTPFGEFNKILATLPGVFSNNELSATYAVRGGNFDENIVYVNNIEVYRPFLIRAGQQEGLSFINPDLVKNIEFSTGGWQAQYGDKLSSMMAIQYKTPQKWGGSVNLGLLTSTAHLEGASKNKKFSFTAGVRYKDARYLLRTLPTQGQYLPRFFDYQAFLTYKFTNRTYLQYLFYWAQNDYFIQPSTRRTDFGTAQQAFSLLVGFDGQEEMRYQMTQQALRLTHWFNPNWESAWIASWMQTAERESVEVEAGYRLAEVLPNSSGQGNTLTNFRDLGTNYQHARNRFDAQILTFETRHQLFLKKDQKILFGLKYGVENIQDKLSEYTFTDSTGYVNLGNSYQANNQLNSARFSGYWQYHWEKDQRHFLDIGARWGYWSVNQQWIISPRLQYAFRPNMAKPLLLKASIGIYQQPPFYRELRNLNGVLNTGLQAQTSLHCIAGAEGNFNLGTRKFKWTAEAYYKHLQNVVPYDLDNVRIRYFALNNAQAFAYGADFRVSGEFVKDAVSWFSLSFLSTQELIEGSDRGFIRRPTDQRLTFAIYFEDYIPRIPSFRVNVQLLFGTGLPFGPPDNLPFRAALSGPLYRRLDIGFSKLIVGKKLFQSLWLGLDVLNVFGIENIISYTWIKDVSGAQYAVPNSLSTRFLNFKVFVKF